MTIVTVDAQRRLSVGDVFPAGTKLRYKMPDQSRFVLAPDPEGPLTVGARGLVSLSALKLKNGDRYNRTVVHPGVLGFMQMTETKKTESEESLQQILERLDKIIELLELQNKQ